MKKAGLPIVDIEHLTPEWSPSPACHHEFRFDAAGESGLALLRHPTHPFRASLRDDGKGGIDPLLFVLAADYVDRVAERYGDLKPCCEALRQAPQRPGDSATAAPEAADFGWLPLAWGEGKKHPAGPDGGGHDPRASFWLRRLTTPVGKRKGKRGDRSAVLLAGNRLAGHACGGEVGLRVVVHVGEPHKGRSHVRITGLSTSLLKEALTPATLAAVGAVRYGFLQAALRDRFRSLARTAFRFDADPVIRGVRFSGSGQEREIVLIGRGVRQDGNGPPRVYKWSAALSAAGSDETVTRRRLVEQTTAIAAKGLLRTDPASSGGLQNLAALRPSRNGSDEWRKPSVAGEPSSPGLKATAGSGTPNDRRVEVRASRIGNQPSPAGSVATAVIDEGAPLRSDALAAAHALIRGQEFFERFDAYGLVAEDHFKAARLPLVLQPRAAFRGASNGEAVNARVVPDGSGQGLFDLFDKDARPSLQVCFGAAELAHREALPNNVGRVRAQYLGLAADRRWAWHEFGHVLNFAATGALEFRFAHSAGDALAAIVADPDSALRNTERLRDLTFPWVQLKRSHARPALRGWCWCGRRSRLRLWKGDGAPPQPGGYFEEQLLSSSLFRLYLCAGGATDDTLERRRAASDYVVYLVMRAIALLGPTSLVPARTADQFVSALIDADIGTTAWTVKPTWPTDSTERRIRRDGGTLHKVIRWAFEEQGLYAVSSADGQGAAVDDTDDFVEGRGEPPEVDIYIPGRGGRERGGYDPVPLLWRAGEAQPWHAAEKSVINDPQEHRLLVQVGNRGSRSATGVQVRTWVAPVDDATLAWHRLEPLADTLATADIGGGGSSTRDFKFQALDRTSQRLQGGYWVLVEANCEGDRSNVDVHAMLPCAAGWPQTDTALLTDLVANDNNLALAIVQFG